MSKHDLKGIDTSKVGNNKFVDYTFEDYQKDLGLSEAGAIRELERGRYNIEDFLEFRGLDLGSGQRGIDLMKEFTSAQDLGEEYGYDVRLPSLGGLTVNEFALKNRDKLIPEGKEIIKRKKFQN